MPPRKATRKSQGRSKQDPNAFRVGKQATSADFLKSADMHTLPTELLQIILNVFSIAFPIVEDTVSVKDLIQKVKGHLFARDFAAAFSEPLYLQVYALRWSAARALGYSHILTAPNRKYIFPYQQNHGAPKTASDVEGRNGLASTVFEQNPSSSLDRSSPTKILCIGGGAGSEIVAFAAAYRASCSTCSYEIEAVDCADWSEPVARLTAALTERPVLSEHASEATKARPENQALIDESANVTVNFVRQDVLQWESAALHKRFQNVALCTIMFTLNELFSTSLSKTTSFLLNLTAAMPKDSHLVVVDSPGSYSEIQFAKENPVQKEEAESSQPPKKYPMKWLLDHTLLEVARKEDEVAAWEKTESEDSLWFRIDQKDKARLRYPIELENMRYQLHVFRKT